MANPRILILTVIFGGIGMAGVGWNTMVLPVRVLGKCGGYDSDIIAGMRWAVGLAVPGVPTNPNKAKVLNMSLGGSGSCAASDTTGKLYRDAIAPVDSMLFAAGERVAGQIVPEGSEIGGRGEELPQPIPTRQDPLQTQRGVLAPMVFPFSCWISLISFAAHN